MRKAMCILLALLGVASGLSPAARATSIQEIVRLEGQGESVLQGFGLVIGLPGTGDSGKDLVVARPLAKLLESQGNPIGGFEELANSRSIALVSVTCTLPRHGAKRDDTIDVFVSAVHNPKSLEGGRLFLAPLRGPRSDDPTVYAVAEGGLVIEGVNTRSAVVRGGARMVRPVDMRTVSPDGSITLVVNPDKAGWTTTQLLASVINDHRSGLAAESDTQIAYAVDERNVRVLIPEPERPDPASFIADILAVRFDPSLMTLPARVVVNERTGTIIATADVQISPVAITTAELSVTTITPPRVPTAEEPMITRERWTPLSTSDRPSDAARLEDLLAAFKRLDVPVRQQIAILTELHKSGRLHAELVVSR